MHSQPGLTQHTLKNAAHRTPNPLSARPPNIQLALRGSYILANLEHLISHQVFGVAPLVPDEVEVLTPLVWTNSGLL